MERSGIQEWLSPDLISFHPGYLLAAKSNGSPLSLLLIFSLM
jgi:hypothetical protein